MATSDSTSDTTKNKYFIYFLIDPRNEKVFYVGYTQNWNARYRTHISRSETTQQTNPQHKQYIKEILDANLLPAMHLREEVYNKADAKIRERGWMIYWHERGNMLTNMHILSIEGLGEYEHPADNYESIKRKRLDIRKDKPLGLGLAAPWIVAEIKKDYPRLSVEQLAKRFRLSRRLVELIVTNRLRIKKTD